MTLTGDIPIFRLPLTGIDPARVAGDPDLAGGSCGRAGFVGGADNRALGYLLESENLLDCDWPLVLFGPSGTGKTALAFSISNRIASEPGKKWMVQSAKDFARRFAHSLETDSTDQWRQLFFGSAGVVLDDMDQLSPFPAAQFELASLLDQLAFRAVPVIVTAYPACLDPGCLVPKLQSRLSAGLCLAVNPPDVDARRVIIAETALRFHLSVPYEVRDHLASLLPVTWPMIQSFFARLHNWMLASDTDARTLELGDVSLFLAHCGHQSKRRSVDSIIRLVAGKFRIKVAEIKSNSRRQSTVLARSVVVHLLRHQLKMSYSSIGSVLGGRDHSTTMHALRRIKNILAADEKIASMVAEIERSIVETELLGGRTACEQHV